MADPALPDTLLARIRDLEQRIRVLETAPRLKSSTMKDGTIKILDSSDVERVVMGTQADATYGFRVNDADGSAVVDVGDSGDLYVYDGSGGQIVHAGTLTDVAQPGFVVVDTAHPAYAIIRGEVGRGLVQPWIPHAWSKASDYVAVTSAGYTIVWECWVENMTATEMQFRLYLQTDSGTTGQVKLSISGVGDLGTSVSFSSAAGAYHTFAAEHGQTLQTGPYLFQVSALRSAGAGNVYVYNPGEIVIGAGFVSLPAGGWV